MCSSSSRLPPGVLMHVLLAINQGNGCCLGTTPASAGSDIKLSLHDHGNKAVQLTVLRQKSLPKHLTLKVLVATTDAQWEGMGDVGSARYELV